MDSNNYNILLTKRPYLPDLPTDIALQTFTDVSLRSSIDTGAERSDHEALSVLGRSACETAFTAILYTRRPNLGGEGIVVRLFFESGSSLRQFPVLESPRHFSLCISIVDRTRRMDVRPKYYAVCEPLRG